MRALSGQKASYTRPESIWQCIAPDVQNSGHRHNGLGALPTLFERLQIPQCLGELSSPEGATGASMPNPLIARTDSRTSALPGEAYSLQTGLRIGSPGTVPTPRGRHL